jgi:hypothetical protein
MAPRQPYCSKQSWDCCVSIAVTQVCKGSEQHLLSSETQPVCEYQESGLHHSTIITMSTTWTTFRFVLILSFPPLLTNSSHPPSLPVSVPSPQTERRIWSGKHKAWRKNKGVRVTLEVRRHQRCWLHVSPELYSSVIIFMYMSYQVIKLLIHFNINLPSTPGSSKWPSSLRFPH